MRREKKTSEESAFTFHPELFEQRARAQEMLADAGFTWLADYGSLDLLHDEGGGLEVCGIRSKEDVQTILGVLRRCFPEWRYVSHWYKGEGRDVGWWIVIQRDPSKDNADSWSRQTRVRTLPRHDEASPDSDVVELIAHNAEAVLLAEHQWIEKRFPGYRQASRQEHHVGGKVFHDVEVITLTGERRKIHFALSNEPKR